MHSTHKPNFQGKICFLSHPVFDSKVHQFKMSQGSNFILANLGGFPVKPTAGGNAGQVFHPPGGMCGDLGQGKNKYEPN